jgi:hypothetical protein
MRRFFPVFIVALAVSVLSAGMAAKRGEQVGRGDRAEHESTHFDIVEATIPQLQRALEDDVVTSKQLVQIYLDRIEAYEGTLNAFIEHSRERDK